MPQFKIGVLSSHNGTTAEQILQAIKSGELRSLVTLLICNNSNAPVLEKAARYGVPTKVVNGFGYPDPTERDQAMLEFLLEFEVDLMLLLGYLKKIGPKVLNAYRGRLLNIHPALLPKYGGPGMYGIHVHQAVLEAKEKETGVTVHHVDEIYDNGPILAQCRIDVLVSDTPESLADRVLHCEHAFLVETLRNLENGDLELS